MKKTLKVNPTSIQVIDERNYKVSFDQGDKELERIWWHITRFILPLQI